MGEGLTFARPRKMSNYSFVFCSPTFGGTKIMPDQILGVCCYLCPNSTLLASCVISQAGISPARQTCSPRTADEEILELRSKSAETLLTRPNEIFTQQSQHESPC